MITRKIRVSLTKFVGADFFSPNVFLLPGTGRVPFIREIYLAFRGEGQVKGRSEWLSCFCCLLRLFQLKTLNMPRCQSTC